MSVTITVGAGCRVKVLPPGAPPPMTLSELTARHGVTEAMLTGQVKSLLLDILARERGQTLDQMLADIGAAHPGELTARPHDRETRERERERRLMERAQAEYDRKRRLMNLSPEERERRRKRGERMAAVNAEKRAARQKAQEEFEAEQARLAGPQAAGDAQRPAQDFLGEGVS